MATKKLRLLIALMLGCGLTLTLLMLLASYQPPAV